MKLLKFLMLFALLPILAFTTVHKYYISVTQINYIEQSSAIQITSRLFIDDFENVLKLKYNKAIVLAEKNEPETINGYINNYLKDKIKITINNQPVAFNFIGKEYDGDIVRCYLEVENILNIDSMAITNKVLFDLQSDQQNIVKTTINSKNKSFILTQDEPTALLKFN